EPRAAKPAQARLLDAALPKPLEPAAAAPLTPSIAGLPSAAVAAEGVLHATAPEKPWALPSIDLLEEGSAARSGEGEVRRNMRIIEETLAHFGIGAKVVPVSVGPVVTPDEVRVVLADPKRVELAPFNGIPHLVVPVVTDHDKILNALYWAVGEMDRRYRLFARATARNIERYNESRTGQDRIPYIVIVIDELADLMMTAPIQVEKAITRMSQLARATGIHPVAATQRRSVDGISGPIKANLP